MIDDFTKRRIRQIRAAEDNQQAPEPSEGTAWQSIPEGGEQYRLTQPSLGTNMLGVIKETPIFNEWARVAARLSNEEDPEFDPLPQVQDAAEEMGWHTADRLANTRSQGEFDAVKAGMEKQDFNNQLISNSALSVAASLPVSLLNSQDIISAAASFGVSAYGTVIRTASHAMARRGVIANTIKAGAASASGSVVGGALTYESNVSFTHEDILLGTAINAPLGALYGRLAGKVRVPTGVKPSDMNNLNDLGGALGGTIKSIFRRFDKDYYRDYTRAGIEQERNKAKLQEAIRAGIGSDMFDEGIENVQWSQLMEELGDIPDAVYDEWWRANLMDERVKNITGIENFLSRLPDKANTLYAKLFFSGDRTAQVLAVNMLESGTGAVVNNKSFANLRELHKNNIWNQYVSPHSSYLRIFQKRRYNQGVKGSANKESYVEKFNRFATYLRDKRDFNNEVFLYGQYKRRGALNTRQWSPEVAAYFEKHVEPTNKIVLDMLKKAQVEGFDAVDYVLGFLPQRHVRAMYHRALAKMGGDRRELSKLLQKSLMSENGSGIKDAVKARKIADAFLRRFLDGAPRAGIDSIDDDAWRIMDEIMEQEGIDIPNNSDLKTFVEGEVRKQERTRRRNTFAHSRTPLDYEVSHNGVSMMDLLDTDVENVLSNYSIQMSGQIALAQTGFKSIADFKKVTKKIVDRNPNLEQTIKELEAGVQTSRSTEIKNMFVLGAVKSGVLAYLNNMGMTQLVEAQTAAATLGIGNYLKNLGRAGKDMWAGRKTPRAARMAKETMQALIPIGKQHWFNKPGLNKELTANPTLATSSIGANSDAVANMLLTAQGYTSGFNQVRAAQEWATAESIMNLITGALREGGDMAKKTRRFLHTMGYDKKLLAKVEKAINKHAVKEDGVWNFNLDKWNPQLAVEYSLTMQRGMGQMVQRTLLGEELPFMGTDTGGLLTQFMAFPAVAMRKQFARNATIGNETLFATTLMGVLIGGSVITARNYMTGAKPEDAFEQVLRNGFVYNSNFGTATQLWDLGLSMTGAPDAWRINPWSAIDKDIINPVGIQAINNFANLPRAAIDLMNGEIDGDSRRAFNSIPLIGGHIATGRFIRKDDDDE